MIAGLHEPYRIIFATPGLISPFCLAARLKRVGEAAALVASLQAEQAALARQIAEAERASAADAAQQERHQVMMPCRTLPRLHVSHARRCCGAACAVVCW